MQNINCQKKCLVNSVCAVQPVIDVEGIGDDVKTFSAVGFLNFELKRTQSPYTNANYPNRINT